MLHSEKSGCATNTLHVSTIHVVAWIIQMCKNINLGKKFDLTVPGFSLTCIPPILINVGGWDLKMNQLILFLPFFNLSLLSVRYCIIKLFWGEYSYF